MTKASLNKFVVIFLSVIFFSACEDSYKDKYFDRPEWLEPPIYEVLQKEGRFTRYLRCVDRTEYATVLKGAGLYTVFAPNDEAFTAWMQQKSYPTVEQIPLEEVKQLVAYSIVYSKWAFDKLAYRFVKNQYELGAFKRKTACYTLPYQDDEFDNNWVVDETKSGGLSYSVNDYQLNLSLQNYKYLPVYTEAFMNVAGLTAADYNTFYPDVVFSGKNVQGGVILKQDILAENGIVHEVSTVNEPLKNMEQLLENTEFSTFKSLLNYKSVLGEYLFKSYKNAADISPKLLETYQKMAPNANITKVFVKSYPTDIGFSPIMENIFSETGENDTEKSGNTLFVPQNEVLNQYIQNKVLKYYDNLNSVPKEVIYTLINTHMANGLIWPVKYQESFNSTGEYINGEGRTGKTFTDAGIIQKQMASNGFIYLIDHVIKSRYFESVYAEIYLNPNHRLLNLAYTQTMREELMKCSLNGFMSERWTVLNFSDDLLREDGFGYDDLNSAFTHAESADVGGVTTRLQRLINTHLFPGLKNTEINAEITGFATSPHGTSYYNGWGYLVNNYGDMIRYKNNQLQAAGNIEDGTFVTVTKQNDVYNNGSIFNVNKLLQYSPRNTKAGADKYKDLALWDYLARAKAENPNVSMFVDYVEKCLKNTSGGLDGVKTEYFYTVLMPNNTAMTSAQTSGYLPTIDKISSDNAAFDINALAKATMFVNGHFMVGKVLADDGLEFIYPVNPLSPNEVQLTTMLKITNEKLDLVNKNTQVKILKYKSGSSWVLRFEPQDILRGNTTLVDGTVGTGTVSYINGVNRGKVNTASTDNFRSNRIACKAVLHEVTNFIRFTVKE